MQTLYAFSSSESDDIKKDETFLLNSLDDMYDLYLSIFALLIEIHKKGKNYNEKLQNKVSGSASDKQPNTKFADNLLLNFLSDNKTLNEIISKQKLNFWDLDFEYVDILFKQILKSDIYKAYIDDQETSFKNDKKFIIAIYTEIIAPNDKLYDYFEDKKLTWVDDIPVINTIILKILRKIKLTSTEGIVLPNLYKDEDDKEFAKILLKKTILNSSKFSEEISLKTTNWDSERLASIDGVLLKMALCEFQKFPQIPFKVTINEYLEIAKSYSTPKSSIFINGILDKIVKEYIENNSHTKIGRGLL